jgi:hypothetical protein
VVIDIVAMTICVLGNIKKKCNTVRETDHIVLSFNLQTAEASPRVFVCQRLKERFIIVATRIGRETPKTEIIGERSKITFSMETGRVSEDERSYL